MQRIRCLPENLKVHYRVRFEVFTAVTMKNGVFWDVNKTGFHDVRNPLQSAVFGAAGLIGESLHATVTNFGRIWPLHIDSRIHVPYSSGRALISLKIAPAHNAWGHGPHKLLEYIQNRAAVDKITVSCLRAHEKGLLL
jgi:hypothetical protein